MYCKKHRLEECMPSPRFSRMLTRSFADDEVAFLKKPAVPSPENVGQRKGTSSMVWRGRHRSDIAILVGVWAIQAYFEVTLLVSAIWEHITTCLYFHVRIYKDQRKRSVSCTRYHGIYPFESAILQNQLQRSLTSRLIHSLIALTSK